MENTPGKESAGEAGAKDDSGGHRLVVGSASMVGQSAAVNRWFLMILPPAQLLPQPHAAETRSELAIPLRSGGRIWGAGCSKYPNAGFLAEDIDTLQLLADQFVAVTNVISLLSRRSDSTTFGEREYCDSRCSTKSGRRLRQQSKAYLKRWAATGSASSW